MEEQEKISQLKTISDSIRKSYSIDPEIFKIRFEDKGKRMSEELEEYSNTLIESGKPLSVAFETFVTEINDNISRASEGLTAPERREQAEKLRERRRTLYEINETGGTSSEEFEALDKTLNRLIQEIEPRAFSSRLQEGVTAALTSTGAALASEISSGTRQLQGALESLGDDFPPLQFAIEKANNFLNFLLGSLINTVRERFRARKERKEEAKRFSLQTKKEVESQSLLEREPSLPSSEVVKKEPEPREKEWDGSPQVVRFHDEPEEKPQPPKITERDNGPLVVRLDEYSIKAIKVNAPKVESPSVMESKEIRRGKIKEARSKSTPTPKGGGLLSKIMPVIMIIAGLLGSIVTAIISMGASLLGALTTIGPVIAGAVGGALATLPGLIKGALAGAGALLGKGAAVGGAVLKKGAGLLAKGGKFLGGVASKTAPILGKVALPLTAAVAVGQGAYEAYKTDGDAGDKAKAFGKGALSSVTFGLSDKLFDEDEAKTIKKIREKEKQIEASNPSVSKDVRSHAEMYNESAIESYERMEKEKMKVQENTMNNSSTSIINNNNNSSTLVNRTSPEFFDPTFNRKIQEGFAT